MQKIALVTDSSCDLDQETITRYGIKVIPLTVVFGEKEYRDGIDITVSQVNTRIVNEPGRTATPAPKLIKETFDHLVEDGYTHIIAVHFASVLSATYRLTDAIAKEIKGAVIEVIDSKLISGPLGLLVRQTARWIEEKLEFHDIVMRIKTSIPKIKGFFVLKTLAYLQRGGRIGLVSAMLGNVLDIKPVITFSEQGSIYTYAKTRGWERSINRLYEVAKDLLDKGKGSIAVMYADALEEASHLADRIRALPNAFEVLVRPISPTLVVHTGPGLLGVAYYQED